MSEPTCDLVAERVALGVPLADLAEHATSCARCQLVVALPARLGSARVTADPGLGFAARMTAGAQHRITARRKRRVAGSAAVAVAACAVAVLAVAHVGSAPDVAVAPPSPTVPAPIDQPAMKDVWDTQDPPPPARHVDPDVRALVRLADIDRDLRGTARWARVEKPLRPYRSLVQGVKP